MVLCFFFNDTATTEIYTLSLHDALPISLLAEFGLLPAERVDVDVLEQLVERPVVVARVVDDADRGLGREVDRKSTRLNSSHANISYAVFCLKKKQQQ